MVHYTILPVNIASCSIPYWYFLSYSEEQIAYVLNPISETDFYNGKRFSVSSNPYKFLFRAHHIYHQTDNFIQHLLVKLIYNIA